MPLPLPSFTHSKWISFFGELTAKLSHHSILVVLDGCEQLKRLLLTRISIAAILQEGGTLKQLLKVLHVAVSSETHAVDPYLFLHQELLLAQLDLLSTMVHLMISLHEEGDGYYSLLVLSNAGRIVEALLELLQHCHVHTFGRTAYLLAQLLRLPLGCVPKEMQEFVAASSSSSSSGWDDPRLAGELRGHVEYLLREVARHGKLWKAWVEVLTRLQSTLEGSPFVSVQHLLSIATKGFHSYQQTCRSGSGTGASGSETTAATTSKAVAGTAGAAAASSSSLHTSAIDNDPSNSLSGVADGGLHKQADSTADASVTLNDVSRMEVVDSDRVEEEAAGEGMKLHSLSDEFQGAAATSSSDSKKPLAPHETSSSVHIPVELCQKALVDMSKSASHDEFFVRFNIIWCLTTTAPQSVVEALTPSVFQQGLRRFLETCPATRQDRTVFLTLLSWLGELCSRHALHPPTRDVLVHLCGTRLLCFLQKDRQRAEAAETWRPAVGGGSSLSPPHTRATEGERERYSTAAAVEEIEARHLRARAYVSATFLPSHLRGDGYHDASPPDGGPSLLSYSIAQRHEMRLRAEMPPISTAILSFLLVLVRACDPSQVKHWVQEGAALDVLLQAIRYVENVRSAPVEAPKRSDGSVSDEVYLRCALNAVQSDAITVAMLSCKLLAGLLCMHYPTLHKDLLSECCAAIQGLVPTLLRIGIHNPTLTGVAENSSASALYHATSDFQASRYTSLGECALIALDTCFWFVRTTHLACVDLKDVLPSLPALSKCTRTSIHPSLRSIYYRALRHLCSTPSDLAMVAQELPSAIHAAVVSVLAYSGTEAQWEAAAAGEWLRRVLQIASTDPETEVALNFSSTALPLKLLDLVSHAALNYTTSVLSGLVVDLAAHQKRVLAAPPERLSHSAPSEAPRPVLLPYGSHSLLAWKRIAEKAIEANEKLLHFFQRAPLPSQRSRDTSEAKPLQTSSIEGADQAWERKEPIEMEDDTATEFSPFSVIGVPTKDALARATAAVESVAAQCYYTAAVFRGLHMLLEEFPEQAKSYFSFSLMMRLMNSALALRSPHACDALFSAVFQCELQPQPSFAQAHHDVVQWLCQFGALWFSQYSTTDGASFLNPSFSSQTLSDRFCLSISALLKEESVALRTRCHLTQLLSSVWSACKKYPLPAVPAATSAVLTSLRQSLEMHSDVLFQATLTLQPTSSPHLATSSPSAGLHSDTHHTGVYAVQCQLLRGCTPACRVAWESGWAAEQVERLERAITALTPSPSCESAESGWETFLVHLSLLVNLVTHQPATCTSADPSSSSESFFPTALVKRFAASVCEGLRVDLTRTQVLVAVKTLAGTRAGQRVLLQEIATGGEPLCRSVFGRVLALTLEIPLKDCYSHPSAAPSRGRPPGYFTSSLYSSKALNALQQQEVIQRTHVWMGYEICAIACAASATPASLSLGNAFIARVVKHKGLAVLCSRVEGWDREVPSPFGGSCSSHHRIPLPALQWLASMSFSADIQRGLFHHPDTLSIIIELAGGARDQCTAETSTPSTSSTLALLILRNLCFLPRLKTSICLDARFLLTFKAALLGLPSVTPLVVDDSAVLLQAAKSNRLPYTTAVCEALREHRSSSEVDAPERRATPQPGTTAAAVAGESSYAPQAGPLVTWAQRFVAVREQALLTPSLPESSSADVRALLPPSQLSAVTMADALGRDVAALRWCAASPSLLHRQELAASALWSLAYDHQKGKAYIRRLLQQEPAVSIDELREGVRLAASVWHTESQGLATEECAAEETKTAPLTPSTGTSSVTHCLNQLEWLLRTEYVSLREPRGATTTTGNSSKSNLTSTNP